MQVRCTEQHARQLYLPKLWKSWSRLANPLSRHNGNLWNQQLSPMLFHMLLSAGYTHCDIREQLDFFSGHVAPNLGRYSRRSGPQWHSFMTDDGTPIELSWSWTEGGTDSTPAVRYSIEPVGKSAGRSCDPANLCASGKFVHQAKALCKAVDLEWFNLLSGILVWQGNSGTRQRSLDEKSQIFFAFDLLGPDRLLKAYFVPEAKAWEQCSSTFDLVMKAIASLSLDPLVSSAIEIFSEYMQSFSPGELEPEVEILAIDCVEPSKSRVKIYVRSQQTSFGDVVDALTLGGKLHAEEFKSGLQSLEQLWRAVLSLDASVPSSEPLHPKQHRTAGILYYYEFKPGSSLIKAKVYIPVRHYGINDREIASGLSGFLKAKGMHLHGVDYADALQQI
jgi:DMATS type aromatic prenyltransferase